MIRLVVPALASTLISLVCALLLLATALLAARHWRARSSAAYLAVRLALFACLTGLILARNLIPFRPVLPLGSSADRLLNGCLEIFWWMMAAGLSIGAMRAFVVLGQRPRESKLMQDVLAALIYIAMGLAIVANVFELPIKGLLATSGAVAIIIGLALQSSLADVFSGIVLDLERPYHVGDWVVVDDGVQGRVMETNWRSTHILTSNNDVAVLPNSVIAKSKLINFSAPTGRHGATLRVRLDAGHAPGTGCTLLEEVLLGSTHILRSPEPGVAVLQLDADSIEYELSYTVSDVSLQGPAQTDILDRIFQATRAAGMNLVPRLGAVASAPYGGTADLPVADRLLARVSLFATLTPGEKTELARQLRRKDYKAGEIVVSRGTVLTALSIITDGVLVAMEDAKGLKIERTRLTPGIYFGETGVLMGKAAGIELSALTHVTLYEIGKEALAPLLKARPSMADELSTVLAYRQLLRHSALDRDAPADHDAKGLAGRLADGIQRLFALH